jgi:predicted RNA binding protein YcfA (HicA-like mRNA interferase family)
MPKKIRELKAMLRRAGFYSRPGKGSHTKWYHLKLQREPVVLAGQEGQDAKRYMEVLVEKAIEQVMRKP